MILSQKYFLGDSGVGVCKPEADEAASQAKLKSKLSEVAFNDKLKP